jgi:TatD DNase family protein
MGEGALPAVLHCYTGGPEFARRADRARHFISFTGIVTFKNSGTCARSPRRAGGSLSRRDRRAIPRAAAVSRQAQRAAYVTEVAKVLAEARGVSFEDICRQTTENFFRLFSKVPRAAAAAA